MKWHEIVEGVIKLGQTRASEGSPADQLVKELNSLTQENPFNHRQRIIGAAKVEVTTSGNSTIRLSDIQGSGQGSGSAALKLLCDLADKYIVTIKLSAYGYDKTPTEDLVRWYEKFGFSAEPTDVEDGVDMMRTP
jgi:hypothetical protein